jgi:Transposase DDE domain
MLGGMLEVFVNESPVAVMVRSTMEHVLGGDRLNRIFEDYAQAQYTRNLLFSDLVDLMGPVVCGVRKSVHAAYQKSPREIGVSITAVYEKLNGIEPEVSAALVRQTVVQMAEVIHSMPDGRRPDLLPGYRVKILDGNCLASTEHRIFELRQVASGPLPGKSLVVLDPALMLVIDVFPCEDGHAQERSLLPEVLPTVEVNDLWVADRNFCTAGFLAGIAARGGYFAIRHHQGLSYESLGDWRQIGLADHAYVFERPVGIANEHSQVLPARLLRVQLPSPTRDGDHELFVLTNLPARIDTCKIANLYRKRWLLETAFQHLTQCLRCEVNTLGYPKAALFSFCMALVSYNLFAVTRAALRACWGMEQGDEQVSTYHLTDEIQGVYQGMMIALPPCKWRRFATMTAHQLAAFLVQTARLVRLARFRKTPRGPKKPRPKRTIDVKHPHVSTKKLLNTTRKSP